MRGITKLVTAVVLGVGAFFALNSVISTTQAQDCSANAVIKCGVSSISSLRNAYNKDTTKGTKNIFNYMVAQSNSMNGTNVSASTLINSAVYKEGYVTKSGNVVVGSTTVATGATSVGRQNIPGSTKHTSGGTTFYTRSTGTSFVSSTIKALVFFDDQGRFVAAVLYDCGNAIIGKNKVTPASYSCDKLTPKAISRTQYSFMTAVTAKNGASVKNYVYNFGDGTTATSTSATASHTYAKEGTYTVTVTPHFTVSGRDLTKNSCKTTVPVKPAPAYSCDNLTQKAISRTEYQFTTKATAVNGAKVTGYAYDFGDGKTATAGASTSHNYAKEGTYNVKVTVSFTVDGKAVSSKSCTTKVTVKPAPTHPGVSIEKTVNGTEHQTVKTGQNFTYELVVKNTGDVALKNVAVSDNAPAGVTFLSTTLGSVAGNKLSATIPSLAKGASYTIKITAVVKSYVSGTITNTACVNAQEVNPSQPTKDDDCDDATIDLKQVDACNTETKVIEKVDDGQQNTPPYTTDMDKCTDHPAVSIEKTVNGVESTVVKPGESFTYELTVTNTGDVDLKNVAVSDTAPAGVTFLNTTLGTISSNALSATIDTLAKDASYTIKVTAVAKEYVAGTITNTACVNAPEVNSSHPEADDDCDTASIELKVQACNTETQTIEWVDQDQANTAPHTTDLSKCEKTPETPVTPETPETPVTELPKTGMSEVLGSIIGLGSLTAATYYYVTSRRS